MKLGCWRLNRYGWTFVGVATLRRVREELNAGHGVALEAIPASTKWRFP